MERKPLQYVHIHTKFKKFDIEKKISDSIIFFYRVWGKGFRRVYDFKKINKTCIVLESGAKIPHYKIYGYTFAQ